LITVVNDYLKSSHLKSICRYCQRECGLGDPEQVLDFVESGPSHPVKQKLLFLKKDYIYHSHQKDKLQFTSKGYYIVLLV